MLVKMAINIANVLNQFFVVNRKIILSEQKPKNKQFIESHIKKMGPFIISNKNVCAGKRTMQYPFAKS